MAYNNETAHVQMLFIDMQRSGQLQKLYSISCSSRYLSENTTVSVMQQCLQMPKKVDILYWSAWGEITAQIFLLVWA
jgi:hypothetical protein